MGGVRELPTSKYPPVNGFQAIKVSAELGGPSVGMLCLFWDAGTDLHVHLMLDLRWGAPRFWIRNMDSTWGSK